MPDCENLLRRLEADVGYRAVVVGACSGWAPGEGVEEHAEGECADVSSDALDQSGDRFGEVWFEAIWRSSWRAASR